VENTTTSPLNNGTVMDTGGACTAGKLSGAWNDDLWVPVNKPRAYPVSLAQWPCKARRCDSASAMEKSVRLTRDQGKTRVLGHVDQSDPCRDVRSVQLPATCLVVVVRISEAQREHKPVSVTMEAWRWLLSRRAPHFRGHHVHEPRAAHHHTTHDPQDLRIGIQPRECSAGVLRV
jgi:hypothetical protein